MVVLDILHVRIVGQNVIAILTIVNRNVIHTVIVLVMEEYVIVKRMFVTVREYVLHTMMPWE